MDIFILNRNNQKVGSKDTKTTIAIVVPSVIVITPVIVLRIRLTEKRAGETSAVRLGMTMRSTTQEDVRTR